MGQVLSCTLDTQAQQLYQAILDGDANVVAGLIAKAPRLLNQVISSRHLAPLHLAASKGQADVMNTLLQNGADVNACLFGQSPLMLACKAGSLACVQQLLEDGANVLCFDPSRSRTPLHYASEGGHTECVERIIVAAQTGPVNDSWGCVRYVNIRDARGATALHLAAKKGHLPVLKVLLDNGALVSAIASTIGNEPGRGSTPLHYAARKGSPDCIQELIAWGSDRTQKDSTGRTAYRIAVKYKNMACTTMLNPNAAEPLVWPSPWKFIKKLNPEAKTLLQAALAQANQAREGGSSSETENIDGDSSCLDSENDEGREKVEHEQLEGHEMVVGEICCICFEKLCTIEMQACGHQMCAACIISLCCHNKPNPLIRDSPPPACPFCRCSIEQLILAKPKIKPLEKETRSNYKRFKRSGSGKKCSRDSGEGSFRVGFGVKGCGKICDSGEVSFRISSGGKRSTKISDMDCLAKQSYEFSSTEICVL